MKKLLLIALLIIGCDSFFDQGMYLCIVKSDYEFIMNADTNENNYRTNGICAEGLEDLECHEFSFFASSIYNSEEDCDDKGYTENWNEADCNAYFSGEPTSLKYCKNTEWFYNPDSLTTHD